MTYSEVARKLTALGCREIPRKGGGLAPQMEQPGDEPLNRRAGLGWP
jgi:hypothetical protein